MKNLLFAAAVLVTAPIASANNLEDMQRAMELGSLIGSETYCGLAFDQEAIEAWIDDHVDPSDMGFASTLNMSIASEEYKQRERSPSAKTAHCRAVEISSRHHGLLGAASQ